MTEIQEDEFNKEIIRVGGNSRRSLYIWGKFSADIFGYLDKTDETIDLIMLSSIRYCNRSAV